MEAVVIGTFIIYASVGSHDSSVVETSFQKKALKKSEWKLDFVTRNLLLKEIIHVEIMFRENDPEKFTNQLETINGIFSSEIYAGDETKKLILTQITLINEIIVIESKNLEKYLQNCHALVKAINGMAFYSGTLYNNEGQAVYDSGGKRTEAAFHVYTNGKIIDLSEFAETEENLNRKRNSVRMFNGLKIPYTDTLIETLPVLPDLSELVLRSKDEICERTVSLLLFVKYACDISQGGELRECRKDAVTLLEKYEVLDCLTAWEQQFLFTDTPDIKDALEISYQYEVCWILLWILEHVSELDFPNKMCDSEYVLDTVTKFEYYDDFFDASNIKDKEHILDMADFTYRLDWVCTASSIKKDTLPHNIIGRVVSERHKAFNWLMNLKSDVGSSAIDV